AEDREVLAEDEHQPAIDRAMTGDHAVAGDALLAHAEVVGAVLDEHVPLLEGVGIEQQVDALARRQFALGVLRLDPAHAAPLPRGARLPLALPQDLLHRRPPLLHFYDSRPASTGDSTAGPEMPVRGQSRSNAMNRLVDWTSRRSAARRAAASASSPHCSIWKVSSS